MSRPLNLQFQKLEGMDFVNDVSVTDSIGLYNINTDKFYNGLLIITKGKWIMPFCKTSLNCTKLRISHDIYMILQTLGGIT